MYRYLPDTLWCATWNKGPYVICAQRWSRSGCASEQSDLSILCLSTYTTVAINSVSGQRSWPALSANCIRALFVRCASHRRWNDRCGGHSIPTALERVWTNPSHNNLSRDVRKYTLVHVRPSKTQVSPRIRAVWSESSLGAFWTAKDINFVYADNEHSDQTARMRRLI